MFGWLKKLYEIITSFWEILPDSVKEAIINAIIEEFVPFFRAYYKNKTGDKNV